MTRTPEEAIQEIEKQIMIARKPTLTPKRKDKDYWFQCGVVYGLQMGKEAIENPEREG